VAAMARLRGWFRDHVYDDLAVELAELLRHEVSFCREPTRDRNAQRHDGDAHDLQIGDLRRNSTVVSRRGRSMSPRIILNARAARATGEGSELQIRLRARAEFRANPIRLGKLW
jgi:hypothetical protein